MESKPSESELERRRSGSKALLGPGRRSTTLPWTENMAILRGQGLDSDCMTLTRFLLKEQREIPGATGDYSQLMNSIQTAVKALSSAVRKAGITDMFGVAGSTNVQGEEVKKLDVLANELFINMLQSSYTTCLLVSEENDEVIEVPADHQGKYIVCFDPLDGSSNVDCLAPIGSIFAILRRSSSAQPTLKDVLVPGNTICGAGYALYGSATIMVLSSGHGVNVFMLEPSIGEFLQIDENVKIPARGKIYSINEAFTSDWPAVIREYIEMKKSPTAKRRYSQRYIGSMVADIHRTLKYGGVFLYPGTRDQPNGKLRLLYECNPMAFLVTQAGGIAISDPRPVLDLQPTNIHQRVPFYAGSPEDMTELLNMWH